MDAQTLLQARVSELDKAPQDDLIAWAPALDYDESRHRNNRSQESATPLAESPYADLAYFITVIDGTAASLSAYDQKELIIAPPEEADSIMRNCCILSRIMHFAPSIVSGPLQLDSQFWVATGRPEHLPERNRTLSRDDFTDISVDSEETPFSTKPFNVGLFTSTGALATYGMWRIYLDLHAASTLFPLPWYTWAVEVEHDVSVREIASAMDWVDFVQSYRTAKKSMLYPNWKRAAQDYDAVHVSLRAVAAIEGLSFQTPYGMTAPAFWGLESTLWLRWRIAEQSLREVVR